MQDSEQDKMTSIKEIDDILDKVGELCERAHEEDHETQRDLYSKAVDLLEPLVIEYRELKKND